MKITKPNITSGEWRLSDYGNIHAEDGVMIVEKPRFNDGTLRRNAKENAKAISAVPDMIDALIESRKRYLKAIEMLREEQGYEYSAYDFGIHVKHIDKALKKAGCKFQPNK